MAWTTTRLLIAALLLATALVRPAPAAPLETSVAKAQAMLIKEDLGDGIFVFRAPEDLDYWTSTNSVVVINDEDVVVFDSPTRAVTARAVIAEIRKLTTQAGPRPDQLALAPGPLVGQRRVREGLPGPSHHRQQRDARLHEADAGRPTS